MRELRIQAEGKPLRILFAFDPRRVAILLLGGNKKGRDRWYEINLAKADKLFSQHLQALRKEAKSRASKDNPENG